MIPRIKIDERKDIRTFARATSHPLYTENESVLRELFFRSLDSKNGKYDPLIIQRDLLANILTVEEARRNYRRSKERYGKAIRGLVAKHASVDRIKMAQSRFVDMQDGETAAKWILDRLRVIGDGIASRALDHDRSRLRLLAEHPPVAAPQLNTGLINEVRALLELSEQYETVVLNAITNFLRVGDVTCYDPKTKDIRLVEVKSSRWTTARTERQGQYLKLVQDSVDAGVHQFGQARIRVVQSSKPLKTYMGSLEAAMQEARTKLGSSRIYGDWFSFVVLDQNQIVEKLQEEDWDSFRGSLLDRMYSIWKRDSDLLVPSLSNLHVLNNFSPNMAPYSVFPIDPELRFRLLSGDFLVMSILNISGIARWLAKRGSNVQILPFEGIEEPYTEMDIPIMRVTEGPAAVEIGLNMFQIAAAEFWMPESIEETIHTILRDAPRHGMTESLTQVTYPNIGKYAWD